MLQAVDADDLQGAQAAARALVTFLGTLTDERSNNGSDNDNGHGNDGVRPGLASASPAPAPVWLALHSAA